MQETVVFLDSLCTGIGFSKGGIVKLLSELSSESSFKSLKFLKTFTDYPDYEDFRKMWKEAVSSFAYYKRDEKMKMLQLGSFLGTTDADNQISTIRLYSVFFENYLKTAAEEYEKYGKVSSLFGMFAGATVFIILL